jgi:hypothetical protein
MRQDEEIPDDKQIRKAWKYHNAGDVLFAARFNYYMVAQSMMFVSFATVFAADRHSEYEKIIETAIALLGIFYAVAQERVNRVLPLRMKILRNIYLKHDPVYWDYLKEDPEQPEEARNIQSRLIPRAFIAAWSILLLVALASCQTAPD